MAASEERDHSIVHLDRERYERDPGDYYDNKRARAAVLREALALAIRNAQEKDDAFSVALRRAYGEKAAGDARYRYTHDDSAVTAAMVAKLDADENVRMVREALERAEYVGD